MTESRRFRYIIVNAIDMVEPGIHSPAGLSMTATEVLTQIADPDNRAAIRELWSIHDKALAT
jgi:hypothetical protein